METKRHTWIWLWYVLAGALILCDQVVKGWVRATMTVGEQKPFIPHFLELYHVENTGAAFSLFDHYTWALTVLSAVVTVALVFAIWKDWLADSAFSRCCLSLVLAGAAGNLIDRALVGKVTDMFNFTFIRFGVFNVADICVVCGVIGYAGWLICTQLKSGEETHDTETDRPQ